MWVRLRQKLSASAKWIAYPIARFATLGDRCRTVANMGDARYERNGAGRVIRDTQMCGEVVTSAKSRNSLLDPFGMGLARAQRARRATGR